MKHEKPPGHGGFFLFLSQMKNFGPLYRVKGERS